MKKILLIILLILMTACSKDKVLTCSISSRDSTVITTEQMILTYQKDKLKTYELQKEIKALSEETKDYLVYYNISNESLKQKLESINGIEVTLDNLSDSFKLTIKQDLSVVIKQEIENIIRTFDYDQDINQIKTDLELEGYTCK